jgi:hypothetical protein
MNHVRRFESSAGLPKDGNGPELRFSTGRLVVEASFDLPQQGGGSRFTHCSLFWRPSGEVCTQPDTDDSIGTTSVSARGLAPTTA